MHGAATVAGSATFVPLGQLRDSPAATSSLNIGRLVVDAVLARDYPIIQGVILLFSGIYVLINLAIDIAYVLLDPRIRY